MLTEEHVLANTLSTSNKDKFTTIINVDGVIDSVGNNAIVRLLRSIAASQSAHSVRTKVEQIIQSENKHFQFQIHVIWSSTSKPRKSYFAKIVKKLPIKVFEAANFSSALEQRFLHSDQFQTDAILSVDHNTILSTDEIDFMFSVWKHFPERINGIAARSHYWDSIKKQWKYSSKWSNEYSMVNLNGAVYHRFYHDLFLNQSPVFLSTVNAKPECVDLALNFVVSRYTAKPPIKTTQRKETTINSKRKDR